jgi:hypothetical protein
MASDSPRASAPQLVLASQMVLESGLLKATAQVLLMVLASASRLVAAWALVLA